MNNHIYCPSLPYWTKWVTEDRPKGTVMKNILFKNNHHSEWCHSVFIVITVLICTNIANNCLVLGGLIKQYMDGIYEVGLSFQVTVTKRAHTLRKLQNTIPVNTSRTLRLIFQLQSELYVFECCQAFYRKCNEKLHQTQDTNNGKKNILLIKISFTQIENELQINSIVLM